VDTPEWLDFFAVGISVAVGALGASWLTRAWRPSVRVLFLGAYLWLAICVAVLVTLAVACINGDCL
jgi:hypothetical protein